MRYTLQELLDLLETVEDKTRIVSLEGCDCIDNWNGQFSLDDGEILLTI